MPYRYTEEDFADIKKRQDANLAKFQQNSGRGLPLETLEAMEHAAGINLDDNGEPVPQPLEQLKPLIPPQVKAKKRKSAKPPKLPVPTEHEECKWLMDWAATQRFKGWPLAEILIHVPNGAFHGKDRRAGAVVARKLREQGLKPGVSDYILPVPLWTKKCPGLWLEMKRTQGGTVSDEQTQFHARMMQMGWRCEVTKGWLEASKVITLYLRSATPR